MFEVRLSSGRLTTISSKAEGGSDDFRPQDAVTEREARLLPITRAQDPFAIAWFWLEMHARPLAHRPSRLGLRHPG